MTKREEVQAIINSYLQTNGIRAITAAQLNEITNKICLYFSTLEELSLDKLSDVDISIKNIYDVFTWNGTKFIPAPVPRRMIDLGDVDAGSFIEGSTPVLYGGMFQALPYRENFTQLNDVSIDAPFDDFETSYLRYMNTAIRTARYLPQRISSNTTLNKYSRDMLYVENPGSTIEITLDQTPAIGRSYVISTLSGVTASKFLKITPFTGSTINGVTTSFIINTEYTTVELIRVKLNVWVTK